MSSYTSAAERKQGIRQILSTAGDKGLSSRQIADRQRANVAVVNRLLIELEDEGIAEKTGEQIDRSRVWRMT